ncbi:unnamed protein product [Acanthoscelides obtectus]|uniref:Uncharacterized protein n=1 Tax=Acanthoscelides obtectus TaxID=200917 RepID=A0A9P0K9L5_ACAOB|nr:unnamed protein product [Acanthoscelides obtectus]CAK1626319.1 hypothetical protein AOBTE_LOCUS3775 [Acanthoscelides obtectus]
MPKTRALWTEADLHSALLAIANGTSIKSAAKRDKKRLTERELQEIVDNFSDFDEDIVDFADESEGEEEVIQYNV